MRHHELILPSAHRHLQRLASSIKRSSAKAATKAKVAAASMQTSDAPQDKLSTRRMRHKRHAEAAQRFWDKLSTGVRTSAACSR